MRSIELNVEKRDVTGKPERLRRAGKIPGIFYGAGGPNLCVTVDAHEFSRSGLGSHGAHLISFRSDETALNKGLALIKAMQTHPVSGAPMHVDFLRLDENRPVTAEIAIVYVGKPAGAVDGGILQPIQRELEVRALPASLPEQIEVDVSALGIHDSIHVEDLVLPEGVEVLYTENFTLVTVIPPVVEKAPVAEAAAEGAVAAPEPAGEAAPEPKGQS